MAAISMAEISWGLLVGLAALGWGSPWARKLPAATPWDRIFLSLGLGLLLLSLGSTGCLLSGLLEPGLPILAAAGCVLSLPSLRDLPRPRRPSLPDALVALWLLAALAAALAPVTDWDTLVYHFALPRDAVAAGRLVHRLDIPHASLPQGAEALWALAWWGGGERAALLLSVGVLLALAGTAGWALRAIWGPESAGWTRLAALGSLSLAQAPGGGAVEPLLALALLLAVSLGTLAAVRGGTLPLVLSAMAAGAALGIKATALCFLPPFVLLLLCSAGWKRAGGVLLVALLLGLAWYLRTFLETGNPFYPYRCPLFPDLPCEGPLAGPLSLVRISLGTWSVQILRAAATEPVLVLGIAAALTAKDARARAWGGALVLASALLFLALNAEAGGRYLGALAALAAVAGTAARPPRPLQRLLAAAALAGLAVISVRAARRLPLLDPGPAGRARLEGKVEVLGAAGVCLAERIPGDALALAGERVLPFPPGTYVIPDYALRGLDHSVLKDAAALHDELRTRGFRWLAVDRSRHGRGLWTSRFLPADGFVLLYEDAGGAVYRLD